MISIVFQKQFLKLSFGWNLISFRFENIVSVFEGHWNYSNHYTMNKKKIPIFLQER